MAKKDLKRGIIMEKTWDLSILYDGFDDEKYASDELALKDAIASLTTCSFFSDVPVI